MYFKLGLKSKQIGTKLRISNHAVSKIVDKFKSKARDTIFGMGINPYNDEVT